MSTAMSSNEGDSPYASGQHSQPPARRMSTSPKGYQYPECDTLDSIYGPLEAALEWSDLEIEARQLQLASNIPDRHCQTPIICRHCCRDFEGTKWFYEAHLKRCKARQNANSAAGYACPCCKLILDKSCFLCHVQTEPTCCKFWAGMSVVEKKIAYPDFVAPTAQLNEHLASLQQALGVMSDNGHPTRH